MRQRRGSVQAPRAGISERVRLRIARGQRESCGSFGEQQCVSRRQPAPRAALPPQAVAGPRGSVRVMGSPANE